MDLKKAVKDFGEWFACLLAIAIIVPLHFFARGVSWTTDKFDELLKR